MSNLEAAIANAPALMSELTQQFIEKRELTDRAKIRLRMKAILDLISVDTTYPPVPGIDGRKPDPAQSTGSLVGQPLTQNPLLAIGQVAPAPGLPQHQPNP